jgi:hypothetical protein
MIRLRKGSIAWRKRHHGSSGVFLGGEQPQCLGLWIWRRLVVLELIILPGTCFKTCTAL